MEGRLVVGIHIMVSDMELLCISGMSPIMGLARRIDIWIQAICRN